MLALIETLKSALQSERALPLALEKYSELSWQAEYPVSVVHEARRVKEDDLVALLKKKNFLDESGFSPVRWGLQSLDEMQKLAPKYLKHVSMLVHKGKAH